MLRGIGARWVRSINAVACCDVAIAQSVPVVLPCSRKLLKRSLLAQRVQVCFCFVVVEHVALPCLSVELAAQVPVVRDVAQDRIILVTDGCFYVVENLFFYAAL